MLKFALNLVLKCIISWSITFYVANYTDLGLSLLLVEFFLDGYDPFLAAALAATQFV